MKRKLVYLEWIDAVAPTDCSWLTQDDVNEHLEREMMIREAGFVMDETKDYLTLCAGVSEEPKDSQWASIFHRMIRIPVRCIRRRKNLTRFI